MLGRCDQLRDWLVYHRAVGLYPLIACTIAYVIAATTRDPTRLTSSTRAYSQSLWCGGSDWACCRQLASARGCTGVVALFPHILKVCRSAEACGATGFDTKGNMWFAMGANELFECEGATRSASWLNVWLASLPAAVLWGGGTAAGEIPPYWISYMAAKAGKENEELAELEHESTSKMTSIQKNIHDWKVWMIEFMKKHGFWGLVAMSAWPNAAFDLCGICCGTFMMPLAFFGATFLGKGLIKAPCQGRCSPPCSARVHETLRSRRWLASSRRRGALRVSHQGGGEGDGQNRRFKGNQGGGGEEGTRAAAGGGE